ncbi:MAG: hypothetical protein LAN83_09585 [Acidobacteriia bacterium]|nr:hypothetical protein [Terriglobia bacterium]
MPLFLISYDVNYKHKDEYQSLWDHLAKIGAVKILFSEWLIVGEYNGAEQIFNGIMPHLKMPDRLLVQEVNANAWWDKLLIPDDDFRAILREARG